MKASAPPPAPDPAATAAAQTQANTAAAKTQQQMNMVDQYTPYGNLNYEQTGKWEDGTPRFSATTKLSPEEQAKQQQQWEFDSLVNTLGINQTKKLTGVLDSPLKLGNAETEGRLMELGRARLDPIMKERRASLETKLAGQGVAPGSEAYDRAIREFQQQENDAYNNLLLTGRQQANTELLTERNQPINETTALMSGGQVQQPSFTNTPTAQVAAPDVAGMTYKSYELGPLAQYQAAQANKQAMMGAIGSAAGMAMGGWARSDRRVKENVEQIGRLENGLPLYRFNYIGLPETHVGLMAQDVELVRPRSVRTVNGIKEVHYPSAVLP